MGTYLPISYPNQKSWAEPPPNFLPTPLAPLDSAQSARSVREDTAELATYFLSDKKDGKEIPFLRRSRSTSSPGVWHSAGPAETITEVPEPPSPLEATGGSAAAEGPSMLTTMFRRSPPESGHLGSPREGQGHGEEWHVSAEETDVEDQVAVTRVPTAESRPLLAHSDTAEDARETSPLLATRPREGQGGGYGTGHGNDLEGQKPVSRKTWLRGTSALLRQVGSHVASILPAVGNPKRWNGRILWHHAVVTPAACLPAVIVGLLLNILDALSYGKYSTAFDQACCCPNC